MEENLKMEPTLKKTRLFLEMLVIPAKGEKIYMTLSKILTPEGHEFPIEAQVLNPKDYITTPIFNLKDDYK
jgi:hypothetical protein